MEKTDLSTTNEEVPLSPVDRFLAELDNCSWGDAPVQTLREMLVICIESTGEFCATAAGWEPKHKEVVGLHFDKMVTEIERLAVDSLKRSGKG